MHRVFHGIRFKVNNEDCGCRETTISFLYPPVVSSRIYPFHLIYSRWPSQRAVFVSACVWRIGATEIRRTSFWGHCSIPFRTNAPEAVGRNTYAPNTSKRGEEGRTFEATCSDSIYKDTRNRFRWKTFWGRMRYAPFSRRGKPISSKFYRLPAARRRFSSDFIAFPPQKTVFLRFFPISRRGKAFSESFDRFPAAGRRF